MMSITGNVEGWGAGWAKTPKRRGPGNKLVVRGGAEPQAVKVAILRLVAAWSGHSARKIQGIHSANSYDMANWFSKGMEGAGRGRRRGKWMGEIDQRNKLEFATGLDAAATHSRDGIINGLKDSASPSVLQNTRLAEDPLGRRLSRIPHLGASPAEVESVGAGAPALPDRGRRPKVLGRVWELPDQAAEAPEESPHIPLPTGSSPTRMLRAPTQYLRTGRATPILRGSQPVRIVRRMTLELGRCCGGQG